MERLIQWLIQKGYVANGQRFADFSSNSNTLLMKAKYDDYLALWLDFMKFSFEQVHYQREEEVREHSQ